MYRHRRTTHLLILLALVPIAFCWSARAFAEAAEMASNPPAARAPLVMVFTFLTPPDASVDADLGYKLKSGQLMDPDASDFADLGSTLKRAIAGKLTDKLGPGTVTLPAPGSEGFNRYLSDEADCQRLAQEAGAKFFLKGAINHIRFQGNTLIPNYYELVVSAKLFSVASGEVVWKISHNLFPHYFSTKRDGSPADVFEGRLIPHVADVITARILAAIQSEAAQSP